MHKILLAFFTYLIFVSEGTIIQVFLPNHLDGEMEVVPRFVLIIICFIAIFLSQKIAIVYGLTFGLLYDLTYTDLIGVYAFGMAFTTYFVTFLSRFFHGNIFIVLVINLLAITLLEFYIYGVYLLIGLATIPYDPFLNNRLIPTLILNGCFVLLIFFPFRKWLLSYLMKEQEK
jgi:rod shape-determining protein MreD